MRLRDKLNRQITIEAHMQTDVKNNISDEMYTMFQQICHRLEDNVDLKEVYCDTYDDVFSLIEKHNVDISDIIHSDKYERFKQAMLRSKVQCCRPIGKAPERLYNLDNTDDYIAYEKSLKENHKWKVVWD